MKKIRVYRQGDVILREVSPRDYEYYNERFQEEGKRKDVVIKGETGHSHIIPNVLVLNDRLAVIKVDKPTQILHEEHKPVTLGVGIYVIDRVRNWLGARRGRGVD